MNFAIVIPAYNEAATIRQLAQQCLQYTPRVIVVDDGSTDDTVQQLQDSAVELLRNETNQGKATTLWRGLKHAQAAGAEAVITLDGDGQHDPADIPAMLEIAAQHPGQIVIAARLKNLEQAPKARLFANRFADFWVSWAAGQRIQDTQSGFRLYPAALIESMDLAHGRGRNFVFESEVLIEASRKGFRCYPVAIASVYRHDARPSHFRPVADIAHIVIMVAWKLISRGFYPQGLFRVFFSRPS